MQQATIEKIAPPKFAFQILPHYHYRKIGPRVGGGSYLPSDVCAKYGLSKLSQPTGPAPTIGILELGGGYNKSDNISAFANMGLPVPNVTDKSIDGARNSPGDQADAEVALDIQVAAAAFSYILGIPANISMFWAPNTGKGFADAIAAAGRAGVSTLSISWGAPEDSWSSSDMSLMEKAITSANAAGVSIFAASGDNNANDGENYIVTDYPASSSVVVGCGGTTLLPNSEVVWNSGQSGTGGGFSKKIAVPSYQKGTGQFPGRGVPDVAGNADPATGYEIVLNGQVGIIGGTSAVAPLYAGIIAAYKYASNNKTGFIHPLLYSNSKAFRDITQGNNGYYQAGPGWDPTTGLGSPTTLLSGIFGSITPPPPPPTQTGTINISVSVDWVNHKVTGVTVQ